MSIRPFHIHIADRQVDDLHVRLNATRWPSVLAPNAWDDGTGLDFLVQLVDHWKSKFDWRAVETRLNRLPQFLTQIDGLDIHFIHQRGVGPSPFPLIITHGWPGSFAEMEQILPLLTDPASHGGDPADAFDVVVPSLPGYGFSQSPTIQGCGTREIAALWCRLMQRLGYDRFGAQGGDMGAAVTTWLAYQFPQQVAGVHLNLIPGIYKPYIGAGAAPISAAERSFLEASEQWAQQEGAYAHMHTTKPQTLAYALSDSPVGLAAWMVEKFRSWSDCGGDVTSVFSPDTLLTEISLHWFHGSLEASLRLYKESHRRPMQFALNERLGPPVGVAHFAKETPMPPRSWVERSANVIRWTTFERGGHFAAMEQPQHLAEEVRAHFRYLR